jgi:hypothetical protein
MLILLDAFAAFVCTLFLSLDLLDVLLKHLPGMDIWNKLAYELVELFLLWLGIAIYNNIKVVHVESAVIFSNWVFPLLIELLLLF